MRRSLLNLHFEAKAYLSSSYGLGFEHHRNIQSFLLPAEVWEILPSHHPCCLISYSPLFPQGSQATSFTTVPWACQAESSQWLGTWGSSRHLDTCPFLSPQPLLCWTITLCRDAIPDLPKRATSVPFRSSTSCIFPHRMFQYLRLYYNYFFDKLGLA